MKVKGLFWNLKKSDQIISDEKSLLSSIAKVITEYGCNLALFCETDSKHAEKILEKLQEVESSWTKIDSSYYIHAFVATNCIPDIVLKPVGADFRTKNDNIKQYYDRGRYGISINQIQHHFLPLYVQPSGLLFGVVHFFSKIDSADMSAEECNHELIRFILDFERLFHSETKDTTYKTILVGDFNLHPYDRLMESVVGLNAKRDSGYYEFAQDFNKNDNYPNEYFCNPMWKFLSDSQNHVSGTHFWNITKREAKLHPQPALFDQIIFRPSMKDLFKIQDIAILSKILPPEIPDIYYDHSFGRLKNEMKILLIDHLPITFAFDVNKAETLMSTYGLNKLLAKPIDAVLEAFSEIATELNKEAPKGVEVRIYEVIGQEAGMKDNPTAVTYEMKLIYRVNYDASPTLFELVSVSDQATTLVVHKRDKNNIPHNQPYDLSVENPSEQLKRIIQNAFQNDEDFKRLIQQSYEYAKASRSAYI